MTKLKSSFGYLIFEFSNEFFADLSVYFYGFLELFFMFQVFLINTIIGRWTLDTNYYTNHVRIHI